MMTLEQFFATHRAPNAIVLPQTRRDERTTPAKPAAAQSSPRGVAGSGEKH